VKKTVTALREKGNDLSKRKLARQSGLHLRIRGKKGCSVPKIPRALKNRDVVPVTTTALLGAHGLDQRKGSRAKKKKKASWFQKVADLNQKLPSRKADGGLGKKRIQSFQEEGASLRKSLRGSGSAKATR